MSRPKRDSGGSDKPPVELTEGEWEIMKVVWAQQPCAAGDVQDELAKSRDWAYSTVKTLDGSDGGQGAAEDREDPQPPIVPLLHRPGRGTAGRIPARRSTGAFDGALTPDDAIPRRA